MSDGELRRLYSSAELIVNLHGGTEPRPEHYDTGRLVYLETDPVQLQIELHDERQYTLDFLEPHVAFFTFGENYGQPGCGLPVSDRFTLPSDAPAGRDRLLARRRRATRALYTTVGNWRQPWRDVTFDGERYGWSKDQEFRKFLDLPSLTGRAFELALASYTPQDRELLESRGWRVRPALDFSTDLDAYRDYIRGSRGEFTVAKDQNVRLRTGWFSDRARDLPRRRPAGGHAGHRLRRRPADRRGALPVHDDRRRRRRDRDDRGRLPEGAPGGLRPRARALRRGRRARAGCSTRSA